MGPSLATAPGAIGIVKAVRLEGAVPLHAIKRLQYHYGFRLHFESRLAGWAR